MFPNAKIKTALQLWPLGLITSERGPWLSKVGTTILAPPQQKKRSKNHTLVVASAVGDDLLYMWDVVH